MRRVRSSSPPAPPALVRVDGGPDTSDIVVMRFARGRERASLTDAEEGVARLAAAGASNAGIALARQTSPRTVANQLASIFRKLGVASRVELALRMVHGERRPR
jgi:DNA-binding NarL/FixJ family response regulator